MDDEIEVVNNPKNRRFEVRTDNQLAVLEYLEWGNRIILSHTVVPKELSGRGIASTLAYTGLEYAKTNGLEVVVRCPFVARFLKSHPEYDSIVVDDR